MLNRRQILAASTLLLVPSSRAASPAPSPLKNSRVASASNGDIAKSWLFHPTDRYQHFVLGDTYEAAGLAARTCSGQVISHRLPEDAVFEDRLVRIADLDGDGKSEIIVVIATQTQGASLAVFGLQGGTLLLKAQTPPIGHANRWLNPSGIGQFTRAGLPQIALVRTPHLSGILEIWEWQGESLTKVFSKAGYSNHRLGSRHQQLFALVPGAQGLDRLALPTLDRRAVALMDFTQQDPEITRIALPGRADGPFSLRKAAAGWLLGVPLEGDHEAKITLPT